MSSKFLDRELERAELARIAARPGSEFDVVARGRGDALLVGECKWQGTKMAPGALDDLKRRTQRFLRFRSRSPRYALFSKSGFSKPLLERARAESVLLFSGAELERVPPRG